MALGHWLKDYIGPHSGGSGGGGSLPPITTENLGQVLGVVPDFDNVSPKEVVPEQTITIVDTEVEVTADWGAFSPDPTISAKMTFNGIEYDATFVTNCYEARIPNFDTSMYVHVRTEVDESYTVTTFVSVKDGNGHDLPGDYNISLTIMAPGVKYAVFSY